MPAPEKTVSKPTSLRDLQDELELLKAQGNKNPARLAELKRILVEG